ncbi:MAG: hypothetical protein ACOX1G_06145, partial [bacterium]
GVEGMDILRLMDAASAYLLRYGGHTAAAGLTLAASALPDLMKRSTERHWKLTLPPSRAPGFT